MKAYAYHCTEINPEIILREGFKSGSGGYTHTNVVEDFYEKYLPKNPMFVSDLKAEVWSKYSKYCMKIDVSGLKLYPDFGHLLDYKAYHDDDCFYWSDTGLMWLRHLAKKDPTSKKVLELAERLEDHTLWGSDFTGEMSRDLLGTFVIDGDLLTRERVVEVKSR